MKLLLTAFIIAFSAFHLQAQNTLVGLWDTGKENTKVEIKQTDDVYTGTVASSNKLKKGKLLLKDIKKVEGEWQGKLYSVRRQKWYDVRLKPTANVLVLTVDAGMMSKDVEWLRAKE